MCKKTLNECRDGRDFERYAMAHGGRVEQCKNGVKIYGANGQSNGEYPYVLIHSNHPHELHTGIRAAIIKGLIAIGLGISVLAMSILQFAF